MSVFINSKTCTVSFFVLQSQLHFSVVYFSAYLFLYKYYNIDATGYKNAKSFAALAAMYLEVFMLILLSAHNLSKFK